jgi:hypothetical protein
MITNKGPKMRAMNVDAVMHFSVMNDENPRKPLARRRAKRRSASTVFAHV